jgi:SAM-dependent methyltransferase
MNDSVSAHLIRAYNDSRVVDSYVRMSFIAVNELRVFAECWPWIVGKSVLDIGVGAGRTIPYLFPFASRYVAIDYSAAMARSCRQRFPDVDTREGDARNLAFPDSSFSFVLFSYNGIDTVHPSERSRVMAEAFRVLQPGGVFAFSTHNLNFLEGRIPGFRLKPIEFSRNPVTLAARVVERLRGGLVGYRNYKRLEKDQFVGPHYARVNEGVHDYSLLMCYADPAETVRELQAAGFGNIRLIGRDGRPATEHCRDQWLYLIASKP